MKTTYPLGPLGIPALCATLATAFACGSSVSDEPQASAGKAGSVGGAGGAGANNAGENAGGSDGYSVAGRAGNENTTGGVSAGAAGEAAGAAGAAGSDAGAGGAPAREPVTLALSGAITNVHDPAIVKDGDTFYLFSTGQGIQVRTSKDLRAWKAAGQVFDEKPPWITTTDASDPNMLWAPEVRYFDGAFHLYYAASKFGVNRSCIGHATNPSLAVADGWVDEGATFCSNTEGPAQDFNAIDANPFQDEQGKLWLSFGSFWGGIKMFRLDIDGNRNGTDFYSLATRANKAVEAPHLFHHGGFYFLFESVDSCCQGSASTYKTMVGRSTDITGPYKDETGALLSAGGGTLVLEGGTRWRGPGHNAILQDGDRYYNVYHSYDADHGGVPTLRISEMTWTDDNWPISAGP